MGLWIWLVIVLDAYLLVTVGPWIGLQALGWRLARGSGFLSSESERLNRLAELEQSQGQHWPDSPRAGRYRDLDRRALEKLTALRVILSQCDELWAAVTNYRPPRLSVLQVLSLAAWKPLSQEFRVWRNRRHLNSLLDEGEEIEEALKKVQAEEQKVPARATAELSDLAAEVRRLYVLWEAEVENGTQGIQELGDILARLDNSLTASLADVKTGAAGELPEIVLQADDVLSDATEKMQEAERDLSTIIENRERGQRILERIESGQALVAERWKALQGRGVTDRAVAAQIQGLAERAEDLKSSARPANPAAYAALIEGTDDYDAMFRSLTGQLDALDDIIKQSKQAVTGDVQLLLQAQAVCDRREADAWLVLDESRELVAEAQELYRQAEEQQSLGTWRGYQTTMSLAPKAKETLNRALEMAESSILTAERLRKLRDESDRAVRRALVERAERVETELAKYSQHWDEDVQSHLEDALARLGQADQAWQQLPETFVSEGNLAQSELDQVDGILSSVTGNMGHARTTIERLEGYLEQISQKQAVLEDGLTMLDDKLLPSLASIHEAMLPELRERFDTWLSGYESARSKYEDLFQVDVVKAVDEWLPGTVAEAREILQVHKNDVAYYQKQVREARRRMQKEWERLQKLDPTQRPRPDVDLDELTAEYEDWQTTGEKVQDNPAVMSALISRRMMTLERRIEAARREIIEGRQALSAMERQFKQQADAIQRTRADIRALHQDSQWRRVDWVLGDGESLWEGGLALQELSRDSDTLSDSINQMQRALNSAQEAQVVYAASQQQLGSALERLNREFRAATTELERVQRQAGQLRPEGPSEALNRLDERAASATGLISMAQNATSFEDALRHLRAAQETLTRGQR